MATGKLLRTIVAHREGGVSSVAFAPDGRSVLSGGWDSAMRWWDVATGKELDGSRFTAAVDQDEVTGVAFSPDGRFVFSCSEDRSLRLWELYGKEQRVLSGPKEQFSGLRASPWHQAAAVASCGTDKSVKVWNLESAEIPKPLYTHDGPVNSVAFSVPDGDLLLSGSDDKSLKLWNLENNTGVSLSDHTDAVTTVAFSPDGRTVISGSRDRTLKLWDVQDKELLRTFTGHAKGVAGAAFCNKDANAMALSPAAGTRP